MVKVHPKTTSRKKRLNQKVAECFFDYVRMAKDDPQFFGEPKTESDLAVLFAKQFISEFVSKNKADGFLKLHKNPPRSDVGFFIEKWAVDLFQEGAVEDVNLHEEINDEDAGEHNDDEDDPKDDDDDEDDPKDDDDDDHDPQDDDDDEDTMVVPNKTMAKIQSLKKELQSFKLNVIKN